MSVLTYKPCYIPLEYMLTVKEYLHLDINILEEDYVGSRRVAT